MRRSNLHPILPLVATATLLVFTWSATPAQAVPKCFGKPATIVGTPIGDKLTGTDANDVIVGLGGTDWIVARGGNDRICGGPGPDSAPYEGPGLYGGPGNDLIAGGQADDRVEGGPGRDRLKGGAGRDSLQGGGQRDVVAGGRDADTFTGGTDIMLGQAGPDYFNYGPGDTVINGGRDRDMVSYVGLTTGVTVDLGTGTAMGTTPHRLVGMEGVRGSNANDRLIGSSDDDFFSPLFGDDRMEGGPGRDVALFATVDFPPSDFVIDLAAGTAMGAGSDTFTGIEDVVGSQRADVIRGDAGNNWFDGFFGNDSLEGREGDDVLYGGDGTDTADGGPHVSGDVCVLIEQATNCESTTLPSRPRQAFLRP